MNTERRAKDFRKIFFADLVVRSGYQVGKTPLLPVFAAMLGASDLLVGAIVSTSTLTGLLIKPLVGILSDRWGRRAWCLLGVALFVSVPFAYGLVQSPGQLVAVRVIHGLATAVFGPVSVALVVEIADKRVGTKLGWFGISRAIGYVLGPAIGGWLVTRAEPVHVFYAIGLFSSLAMIPLLLVRDTRTPVRAEKSSLFHQFRAAFNTGGRTPSVWLSGMVEGLFYVAVYSLKTFLPLRALADGSSLLTVGLLLSVQEAVHLSARPLGGYCGDRIGHGLTVAIGLIVAGVSLMAVPLLLDSTHGLVVAFVFMGLGQAMLVPSIQALIAEQIHSAHLGAGVGMAGSLRNAGKVLGPIVGGVLTAQFSFSLALVILGGLLVVLSVAVFRLSRGHLCRDDRRR
ncbi:MAG: MFS transporter [Deltaproteobacteria bacterium]|nr:MFS transporter [Deltaproteobacteria bacterium]